MEAKVIKTENSVYDFIQMSTDYAFGRFTFKIFYFLRF